MNFRNILWDINPQAGVIANPPTFRDPDLDLSEEDEKAHSVFATALPELPEDALATMETSGFSDEEKEVYKAFYTLLLKKTLSGKYPKDQQIAKVIDAAASIFAPKRKKEYVLNRICKLRTLIKRDPNLITRLMLDDSNGLLEKINDPEAKSFLRMFKNDHWVSRQAILSFLHSPLSERPEIKQKQKPEFPAEARDFLQKSNLSEKEKKAYKSLLKILLLEEIPKGYLQESMRKEIGEIANILGLEEGYFNITINTLLRIKKDKPDVLLNFIMSDDDTIETSLDTNEKSRAKAFKIHPSLRAAILTYFDPKNFPSILEKSVYGTQNADVFIEKLPAEAIDFLQNSGMTDSEKEAHTTLLKILHMRSIPKGYFQKEMKKEIGTLTNILGLKEKSFRVTLRALLRTKEEKPDELLNFMMSDDNKVVTSLNTQEKSQVNAFKKNPFLRAAILTYFVQIKSSSTDETPVNASKMEAEEDGTPTTNKQHVQNYLLGLFSAGTNFFALNEIEDTAFKSVAESVGRDPFEFKLDLMNIDQALKNQLSQVCVYLNDDSQNTGINESVKFFKHHPVLNEVLIQRAKFTNMKRKADDAPATAQKISKQS